MESDVLIIVLFVTIFLGLLILIQVFVFSKKKSKITLAEIEKIEILFSKDNKILDCLLGIYYKFTVKKKEYKSFCKIPFSELMELQNNMEIYYNKDLELPVLKVNQEYFIGNEAIEYKLLQILTYLPIRYLTSDPKRNFTLPLNKKYFLSKK